MRFFQKIESGGRGGHAFLNDASQHLSKYLPIYIGIFDCYKTVAGSLQFRIASEVAVEVLQFGQMSHYEADLHLFLVLGLTALPKQFG